MSGARLSPVEWDLSAVIGLFHALSTNNVTEDSEEPANSSAPSAQARASSVAPHHDASQSHKHLLGNFDSIWKFLDVPLDAPAPTVTSSTDRGISTNEKHRILDGQGSSASKGITWQDGLDGTGSGDDNRPKPKAPCAPRNTLSKKQKKQLRRQLKRTASPAHPLETTSGDSDSPEHPSLQARQSVDRQQIIQQILYGNAQSTLRTKSTKVTKSPKVSKIVKKKAAPGTPTPAAGTIRYRLRNRDVPAQPDSLRQNAHAFDPILAPRPAKIPNVYRIEDLAKQQTPTTLQSNQTLIASAYQTPPKPAENPNLISRAYQTPIQATKGSSDAPAASEMSEVPQRPTEGVELALYMYEKSMDLYDDHATAWETYHKVLLYDKLKILFPLEHQTLNSFYRSPALEPNGVHVFVDASNIIIGFHDALKLRSSLPLSTRLPRQPFSFTTLALILERSRPCAKRVLSGSETSAPYLAEARRLGYECNTLDRVHKAKPLTDRQRYFAERDRRSGARKAACRSATSGASGTDDPPDLDASSIQQAAQSSAELKWVEQAVDEILHLKIMESVVDAEEGQSGTIVLATGDAAEAEYSGGFLRMAERALKRGWRVEVVSFRRNMSEAWRSREWRERWGERFTVLELERFLLELGRAG